MANKIFDLFVIGIGSAAPWLPESAQRQAGISLKSIHPFGGTCALRS